MGLDIYSGTLTRYYNNNWKTVSQQWAEENGYKYETISLNKDEDADIEHDGDDDELSEEEIQNIIEEWEDNIVNFLSAPEKPLKRWPEDNIIPYYTNKPDWDAFGALLLRMACDAYGEKLPINVTKNWDFYDHPLIQRLQSDKDHSVSLPCAKCWLPLNRAVMFEYELPDGSECIISTTAALHLELDSINKHGWKADEETIINWIKSEGYPLDNECVKYDTDSLAKFAYSIFYESLKFSEENNTPIILDW